MNWARALIRLWIVASVLWVGCCGAMWAMTDTRMTFMENGQPEWFPLQTAANSTDLQAYEWLIKNRDDPRASRVRDTLEARGRLQVDRSIEPALGMGLGPPAIFLVLGLAGCWVIRGFRRSVRI